jgi:hypothetical protein
MVAAVSECIAPMASSSRTVKKERGRGSWQFFESRATWALEVDRLLYQCKWSHVPKKTRHGEEECFIYHIQLRNLAVEHTT